MPQRYLLSIDGGGIRGILPATALVKLEQVTGRPAAQTLSFAAGIPAARILDIYLKRGREIFSPRAPWNTLKRLATGSMYSVRTLHDVLREEFGAARDLKLNDSPIDLLLTAKGLNGMPWYFVRDNPNNSQLTGRLKLLDCAVASAAAPTYFEPWTIPEGPGTLVDGGVGVTGNPVYQACVEAFYYTGAYQPDQTTVISLGTGRYLPSDKVPHSITAWLEWILGELLRSPGEQQTQIVQRHFPDTLFYRLDFYLPEAIDMDGVEAIDRLRRYGEQFAARIDWQAMLAGADTPFRVRPHKTLWQQYKMPPA